MQIIQFHGRLLYSSSNFVHDINNSPKQSSDFAYDNLHMMEFFKAIIEEYIISIRG